MVYNYYDENVGEGEEEVEGDDDLEDEASYDDDFQEDDFGDGNDNL